MLLWRWTRKIILLGVTKGENSSNEGSDEEEEIVMLPSIERAEAETDCDSDISDDENEGLAHYNP